MPVKKFGPYRQSIVIHRSLEPSLLGFPIAFMLFCVIPRLASQDHYLQFVVEDCPVELVTGLAYFLTLLGTIHITVNSGVGSTRFMPFSMAARFGVLVRLWRENFLGSTLCWISAS